jgi:hypothetical protein
MKGIRMKMIKALLLTAAASGTAIGLPASAAELWDGTGATDAVSVTQFGAEGATVASGTAFTSTGGRTGTFTTSGGGVAYRLTQGVSFGGNFAPNEPLLYNGAAYGSNAGDLIFTFDTPVFGVGANFMSNFYGNFVARLTLNDGSFFDVNGVSTGAGDGSAAFVGAKNAVANITSVTFHQQAGTGGNDFAIDSLDLLTAGGAVPEPATWALLILGFAGIGAAMRVQRRREGVTVHYA